MKWHYTIDGRQQSPCSDQDLIDLARRGALKPEDLVWFDGLQEWLPAKKLQWLDFLEDRVSSK